MRYLTARPKMRATCEPLPKYFSVCLFAKSGATYASKRHLYTLLYTYQYLCILLYIHSADTDIHSMLFYCWTSVANGGSTMQHHLFQIKSYPDGRWYPDDIAITLIQ